MQYLSAVRQPVLLRRQRRERGLVDRRIRGAVDPVYLLIAPGLVLIAAGIYAVFKVANIDEGTTLKMAGIEVTSKAPGVIMIVMGLAVLVPAVNRMLNPVADVTAVELLTDTGGTEAHYGNIRCPIYVPLQGHISVGSPGSVTYRFLRQDGWQGPVTAGEGQVMIFDRPGTQPLQLDVPVTTPEGEVHFTQQVEVLEPENVRSEVVRVSVLCDPSAPQGPPVPPPDVEPPG